MIQEAEPSICVKKNNPAFFRVLESWKKDDIIMVSTKK